VFVFQVLTIKTDIEGVSTLPIEQIAFLICRGGWPASVNTQGSPALRMSLDYVEAVINYDVSRVDEVEKNPERVRLLLRSLARNISTLATYPTLKADIETTEASLSENSSSKK
jgi:predicted AAA+ superfamily ATPase